MIFIFSSCALLFFAIIFGKHSISRYISIIYFFFSLGVFIIFDFWALDKSINLLFVLFNLSLFFITLLPFSKQFQGVDETYVIDQRLIDLLLFMGIICFLVNVYIIYTVISSFLNLTIRIDEFKNAGHAGELINTKIPVLFEWYSHIASPLAYIFIGILFYSLVSNSKVSKLKLFLYLIVTLNLPMYGLLGLSRSHLAQYLLLMSVFYLVFRDLINENIKTLMNRSFVFFIGLIASMMMIISFVRFSERSSFSNDLISNPILYSIFDYTSQHYYNLVLAFNSASYLHLTNGVTFTTPFLKLFGAKHLYQENQMIYIEQLGYLSRRFIGLFATLTIEFNFIGSLFVSLLFFLICFYSFYNKSISQYKFILLPIIISPLLMQFANSWLSYLSFQFAIIYTIVLFFFRKKNERVV